MTDGSEARGAPDRTTVGGSGSDAMDVRGRAAPRVRVELPYHLRNLARLQGEVVLELRGEPTRRALLDALEAEHPVLRGTIRDHATGERRPFLRYFACARDVSFEPPDALLPEAVVSGAEPFLVVGSLSGG